MAMLYLFRLKFIRLSSCTPVDNQPVYLINTIYLNQLQQVTMSQSALNEMWPSNPAWRDRKNLPRKGSHSAARTRSQKIGGFGAMHESAAQR